MQSHRNYHLRVDSQLSFDEIRNMVEKLDDGTYFLRIDPDAVAGPFVELHGDPKESTKIAEKLDQMARAKG